MFKALLLTKTEVPAPQVAITELDEAQLPAGDVLVQVSHSTLNYKDALAITGKAPVVRSWPMVPGIDFAGAVLESSDPRYRPGDAVLLNGWGVGESHWGGLAQKVRVKADWLLPLPAGLTAAQAMAIGTAGYTAMLCVMALQRNGLLPAQGPVLVTGANGGVGSIAIALLARWTAWAATPWPTSARASATAAWWRPAGWRRAWTSRPRWRPSFCAASRWRGWTA